MPNMYFIQKLSNISIFLALFIFCNHSFAGNKSSLAVEAYHQLEGNVFNREEIQNAVQKINRAEELNQQDSWVYLSASMFSLIHGYRIGDWYELETFKPGSIDEAMEFAKKALSLDPNNSQAYAHLARIHIIKGITR